MDTRTKVEELEAQIRFEELRKKFQIAKKLDLLEKASLTLDDPTAWDRSFFMELDGVYLRTLTSKQGEVKIAHAADNVLTEYRLPSDFDENHERLTAAIHKLNLTKTNTKDDFEKIQSRIDIQIGFVRFVGLALVIVFIAMLNRYNIIPLLYVVLTIFATTILVTVLKYFHFAASMQFEILKRTKAIDHKIK